MNKLLNTTKTTFILNKLNNNISHLIFTLIENQCNFLVGAGVSMLPPCNLPSGPELKYYLVKHLVPNLERERILKVIQASKKFESIIPEILFQRAFEVIDKKLLPFFEILKHANSNQGHVLLGICAEKYKCKIFTTNFDELIDNCLLSANLVTHLHGHLKDTSNMMIRINQVGRGLSQFHQKLFRMANKNKSLIVLGYSANDKDVVDVINSSDIKEIIWIAKNTSEERLQANLKQIRNANLTIIQSDLNVLFNELSLQLGLYKKSKKNYTVDFDRTAYLNEWSSRMTLSEKYSFSEKLFFDLENYNFSLSLIKKAIRKEFFDNVRTKSWFYNEAAYTSRNMGNLELGLQFIDKAINYHDEKSSYYVIANSFNIKGILLLESIPPQPKEALIFFHEAETNLRKFKPDSSIKDWQEELNAFFSRIYNNIGLANATMNNFTSSVEFYKKSLRLKRKVGNLEGLCVTSVNICLSYLNNGNKSSYRYWRKKIFFLFNKYGFAFSKAYFFRECGAFYCTHYNIKVGLRYFRLAEEIYVNLPNPYGLKITLSLINKYSN